MKWYGHSGQSNGAWLWSANSGAAIGSGWNGFQAITAAPDGTIYAVDSSGNLRWYQDLCRNGTSCWHASSGTVIGWGWSSLKVIADEGGVIYTIDGPGNLRWYKNLGQASGWAWASGTGNTIGNGWNTFGQVFTGRSGILYGVDSAGGLRWYRDLVRNGQWGWASNSGTTVDAGWLPLVESPPTPCFATDVRPIDVAWTTPPGTTDSLGFVLRNRSAAAKTVIVDIVARGLDGRQEQRSLFTTTLTANGSQNTSLPKSYIPIWSTGGQSAVFLSIQEQGSSEPPVLSRDLVYELDASFSAVTVYGEHGKPFQALTPEAFYGRDPGQTVPVLSNDVLQLMATSLSSTVAGRIESNGQFQTWANPALAGQSTRGPTILLDGTWGRVVSDVLEILETPPIVNPAWQLCLEHRTRFQDERRKVAGQMEAYRSSSQGTFPARYLWLTILREQSGTLVRTPIFNGTLDQAGCVQLPNLAPGRYTAWTFERIQMGTTVAKVYDYFRSVDQKKSCFTIDAGVVRCPDEYPVGAGIGFTVGSNGQLPAGLAITLSDVVANTANVAATYGQAMFAPDNGFVTGETYVAFANEQCPGYDNGRREDACFFAGAPKMSDAFGDTRQFPARAVYLGWTYSDFTGQLSTSTANADFKYVVAHEIGHQIGDRLLGQWAYAYDKRAGVSVPQLCACDGLNPSGNEIHCLQSSEQQGAGQNEGYGHYVAGNVWNSRADAQCVFTYYKNFRRADGGIDVAPSAKACNQAVRWAETYCPRAARSSEYDWMGFYTAIARASGGSVPQADLKRVYGRMCTGSPTSPCTPASTSSWAGLDAAAQAEFGAQSARYATFFNSGSAYGITR